MIVKTRQKKLKWRTNNQLFMKTSRLQKVSNGVDKYFQLTKNAPFLT